MTETANLFFDKRYLKITAQVIYWLCYVFCIWFIVDNTEEFPMEKLWLWFVVSMPFKFAIFYGYYYFIIPKWFARRWLYFIGVTLGILLIYPVLKLGIDNFLGLPSLRAVVIQSDDVEIEHLELIVELIRRFATPFGFIIWAFFLRFVVDWFKNLEMRSRMEKEQLRSELMMLRNQVNPHFLFNVLNNIDTLVYPHSQEASDAIVKLSSIMRYMLYDSNTEWVSLQKEVDYLKSYIELQNMRLKDTSGINIDLTNFDHQINVAPMLLVPFVENAFKHAGKDPKIEMSLTTEDDKLMFQITNSIDQENNQKDEVGGIGLQNVQRRLDLLYPDKHQLEIKQEDNYFKVSLSLETA